MIQTSESFESLMRSIGLENIKTQKQKKVNHIDKVIEEKVFLQPLKKLTKVEEKVSSLNRNRKN